MVSGRVIAVGAINTDFVITSSHLPAPGETVVGGGLQIFGGGKAANAAVAAARAGASVFLIGAVGADDAGANALAELRRDGVNTSGVAILGNEPTGAALIVVDARGENQIALGPGANGAVSSAHVRLALADSLPAADVVLVSTEIPVAAVAAALEAASQAGIRCVLNPAPVIPGLLDLLVLGPMLTPNEIELEELTRGLGSKTRQGGRAAIDESLRRLAERTRAPVIVTLGGEGCAVCLPDGEVTRYPARAITTVVDTTGAGDTFNGVLATRLAAGDPLLNAIETALLAASISVTAVGARAGMPTSDAIAKAATQLDARRPTTER